MIVTSFFPGRIRLRAKIFKDKEICDKALSVLKELDNDSITNVQNNPITGSVLIEYIPEKIPTEKIEALKDKLKKLNYIAENYSIEKKQEVFTLISEIENSINWIRKKLNLFLYQKLANTNL